MSLIVAIGKSSDLSSLYLNGFSGWRFKAAFTAFITSSGNSVSTFKNSSQRLMLITESGQSSTVIV